MSDARGWCKKCQADRAIENVRPWSGEDIEIGECRVCQNTIVVPEKAGSHVGGVQ